MNPLPDVVQTGARRLHCGSVKRTCYRLLVNSMSSSFLAALPRLFVGCALIISLAACQGGMPEGVTPVGQFDVQRYAGKWYEIARLDNRFERGLTAITAEYALRDDGTITVLNSGTSIESGERESAEGKARFAGPVDEAFLQVSFFGPFYASYIVFELGQDYDYAFVSGSDTDYLWLLAREPVISDTLKDRFVARAGALGFAADKLVWVEHGASAVSTE